MQLRTFLAVLALLLGTIVPAAHAQAPADADEQVLKTAGSATDNATLLQLLGRRTLRGEDHKGIEALVRALDSEAYAERQNAGDELLRRGPLVLPFLRQSLKGSPSLELRRRAEEIVRKVETTAGNDVTAAAVRLLAARQAPAALDVLLAYLPNADETWLQDEVLTSIGRLGIKQGRVDPKLLAAVRDGAPAQRAAALYLLGRRADATHRRLVRSFLADPVPLVRERAAEGLVGKRIFQNLLDTAAADGALLKVHGVTPSPVGLLEFLRKRTPDAADQARLAMLVHDLGSTDYVDRYLAAEALVKAGTPALAFLRPALVDPDTEVARRARRCIEEIRRGPGPALPAAVVRRLAAPGVAADAGLAVQALLRFAPFVEDASVEEEVLNALAALSVAKVPIDPAVAAALVDALPARRAAAAFVLGTVGTAEQVAGVRKLLADSMPDVRLRAAQGLLAAHDKVAVPALIALLGELPVSSVWSVEEVLARLAGDQAPTETASAPTPAGRQKAVRAWQKWWQDKQASIDLARAAEGDSYLGLVTVCEYDAAVAGQFQGQVWETPRNGPPRLKITGLTGPMDAHVLRNGRVLIAENGASRVTERDRDGTVKWEYQIQGGNPICCERLANGNTFIATYNQLIEVRPDKTEVYRFQPGPQFYVFCARKTRTGTVACMTAQGVLLEVDPIQAKTVRTINLGQPAGGWSGVEPLPNGHFLIATMNNATVREVDEKGTTVWSVNTIPGVFRATRLPNGNTLVVSMNTREIAEIDRAGAVRWRKTCQGRPWSVHYR